MPLLPTRPNILKHFNTNVFDDIGAVSVDAINTYGSPTISSVQQRFTGKNSMYVSTSPQRFVRFINDESFNFGIGDFTISFSEYLTSVSNTGGSFTASSISSGYAGILMGYISTNGYRYLYLSSDGTSWNIADSISLGTIASCLNVWVDWELGRKGDTFYVFKNGVLLQTFKSTLPIYYNPSTGLSSLGLREYVAMLGTAYVCEFLTMKGTCLHTESFTPITEPYTFSIGDFAGFSFDQHLSQKLANKIGVQNDLISQGLRITKSYLGEVADIINSGLKSIKNSIGKTPVSICIGNKSVKKVIGESPIKEYFGVIGVRSSDGRVSSSLYDGYKKSNKVGFSAPYHILSDSNASFTIDLLVTPTFTYKESTIGVSVRNKLHSNGKYQLIVNSVLTIDYMNSSEDISSIEFNIPLNSLQVGDNLGRINYLYEDGSKEFVNFVITSESLKRQKANRVLKSYTGGFDVDENIEYIKDFTINTNEYSGLALKKIGKSAPTGIIKTTAITSIDLSSTKSISNISIDSNGCLFLVSFDNFVTLYSFINGAWVKCNAESISVDGMTKDTINAITEDQWDLIFQKTKLDFLIYLDNKLVVIDEKAIFNVTWGNGWSSTSTSYTLADDKITISRVYAGRVNNYGGHVAIYKRNGQLWKDTGAVVITNYYPGKDDDINSVVVTSAALLMNDTSCTLYGGYARAYLSSITASFPLNLPPVITNVSLTPPILHSGNTLLTAIISDPEEDDIQYRVKINSTEIIPWTEFIGVPKTLETILSVDTCPVGTNDVIIEAYDGDRYATYQTYITRTNENPTIVGILSGRLLTATIGDPDNDTIRYRILLNGIVKQDWSSLVPSPASIRYVINRKDILVGQQNSLVVEIEDALRGTGRCIFDFVGKQYKENYAFIM